MAKKPLISVDVVERERGWGARVLYTRYFKYPCLAKAFAYRINKKNTAPTAPDYYIQAEVRV